MSLDPKIGQRSETYGLSKFSTRSSPSKIVVDPGSGKNLLSKQDLIIGDGFESTNNWRKL